MKISLNVVAHNEEHRIRLCLQDAWPWVDEIVVIDQASTDLTLVEARAGGADVTLVDQPYGYCEASRQLARDRSTGDWILVLDADEVMTPRLKYLLRDLVEASVDGYRLTREGWVNGAHDFTGDSHYRLFRRDTVRFLNEVHTEPQPVSSNIQTIEWPCIFHWKSLGERIADELRCEALIERTRDPLAPQKLALNVFTQRLREQGIDPQTVVNAEMFPSRRSSPRARRPRSGR